ncbi:MAG: hypothetical protein ABH846_01195 [Patescibacteria group bacterium]
MEVHVTQNPETSRQPLDFVATHTGAHFEEQVGLALVEWEGYHKFVWRKGSLPQRLFLVNNDQAHREFAGNPRALIIGMAGGLLDEHKSTGRVAGTCAAMLLADFLGVADASEYQVLLREAYRADTHKNPDTGRTEHPGQLELSSLIVALHVWTDLTDEDVYQKVRPILFAYRDMGLGDRLEPGKLDNFRRRVLTEYPHMDQTHALGEPRFFHIAEEHRACLTTGSVGDDKPTATTVVLPMWAPYDTLVKAYIIRTHWGRLWSGDRPKFVMVANQLQLNEYLDRDDVVFVGIEGGQFPQSRTVKSVARRFGVENWPEYRSVIASATAYAKDPTEQPAFELGRVVETMNVYGGGMKAFSLYRLVSDLIYVQRTKARETYQECPRELEEKLQSGNAQRFDNPDFFGEVVTVMVPSDNPGMANFLRSGAKADVAVLATDESKSVFARTDDRDAELSARNIEVFRRVVREIVMAESEIQGINGEVLKQRLAEVDEAIAERSDRPLPGAEWWYLFAQGYGLMNGSHTIKRSRPTPLDNTQLRDAVLRGVITAHVANE